VILSIRDGETRAEFIARIVATPSRKPTDEELDAVWSLLPPVPIREPDDSKAA
jgi:hypothetical protein